MPPNVVLITLDTTRADHLGCYGYGRARTPVLDGFATGAVLWERAYSTSSWTLPSHASLFTGLLPMEHGAQTAADGPVRRLGYGVRPLGPGFTTLAELLGQHGYRTAGIVGGPALNRELGVAQGFEHWEDDLDGPRERLTGKRAAVVADRAIAQVREFGTAPFFLFVNFFDPHAPYRPPAPFDEGLPAGSNVAPPALLKALIAHLDAGVPAVAPSTLEPWERSALEALLEGYDAEIAYMDHHLGRLLDALAAAPRGRETLILITADHGESFGEHYFLSHGAHLYEDNVRVPLLVRYPDGGGAGRRVAEPVQNHRTFATILDEVGIARPEDVRVRSLDAPGGAPRAAVRRLVVRALERAGWAIPPRIVTQVNRSDSNVRLFGKFFDRDLHAIYDGPSKLIESSRGGIELYDLETDPAELSNRTEARSDTVAALAKELRVVEATHPPRFEAGARVELSPETEEALRGLGYLD